MPEDMCLALDIGNTHVSVGVLHHRTLQRAFQLETCQPAVDLWREIVARTGAGTLARLQAIGISSVVPGKGEEMRSTCPVGIPIRVLTRDTQWPMRSLYSTRLGTDRILAAIAARELWGAPVVAVDIGTAVTVDLVNRDGIFAGGIILAGAGLRGRALHEFTAVLPLVSPTAEPPPLLGLDTEAAILSGLYHGLRHEILGLVNSIREFAGGSPPVVLTGSGSVLFRNDRPQGWHIEQWLILHGIATVLRSLETR